jgi:hypothetical protein
MPADAPARTPAEAVRLQYLASATGGTVCAAARADYAAVLTSEGHQNRGGRPATALAGVIADAARANAA